MKSFFKLSIAAVLFGAMMFSASAFAAEVAKTDNGTLDVNGTVFASTGYFQPAEIGGEAPPAGLETNSRGHVNFAWKYEGLTANAQLWFFDRSAAAGGRAFAPMAWVSWNAGPVTIDVGSVQDPSWSELAVDWETHMGADSIGQSKGAFYMFPEGTRGTDITFNAGAIKAGVFLSDKGLIEGGETDYAAGNQANTYIAHLEFSQDALWVNFNFGSEAGESAGSVDVDTDGDGETDSTAADWGNSESGSNTAMKLAARYSMGFGKIKVQYISADGDAFEEAATDISLGVHINVGAAYAFVEYESFDVGGDADPVNYTRVGYRMPVVANASMQFEYEMSDNGDSVASAPRFGFVAGF